MKLEELVMKHRILVAVDGEKKSWNTVRYVGLACAGKPEPGFEIVIFHVLPPLPPYGMTELYSPQIAQLAEQFTKETRAAAVQMLAQLKEHIVEQGVEPEFVTTEIAPERGSIAPQILQAATAHHCDTIALGRRGKSMFAQFFLGSVVEYLLRHPTGFTIWVVE
jgi:nucleotide-binding universal stress UspA family protein